ncbi:hypothetical protein KEM54_005217 [Ascosphaera aggregata]|nr:hypothetical protein KEM54_005217 [Ascosphaera aggregata]
MYTTNLPYRTGKDSHSSRNQHLQVANPDDPSQTVPLRYREGSHDAHNMRVRLMHPDAFEDRGDRMCSMIRIVLAGFVTKVVEIALDIIHGQTAHLVEVCLSLIELVELAGLAQTLDCREIMTFHITSWFKAWEIGSRLVTSPDWSDDNLVVNLLKLLWAFPNLPKATSLFQTASLHAIKDIDSPILSMPCRPYLKKLAGKSHLFWAADFHNCLSSDIINEACINEQRTKLIERLITPIKGLHRDPRLKCLKCGHTHLCDCALEFAWARSLGVDFARPHVVSRPYIWCGYRRLETTIYNNLMNAKRHSQLCYAHCRFQPFAEELRNSVAPLNLRDFSFEAQDRSYRPEIIGYVDGPPAKMPQAGDPRVFPGPHDYKNPFSEES